jgi:integral membrane sensor domain MASE1
MSKNGASNENAAISPAALLFAGLGVFISVLLSFELAQQNNGILPIWFANAFLLAILLNHSSRTWPSLFLVGYGAYFASNMFIGNTVATSGIFALASSVEVLVVAGPLRFLGFDRRLTRLNAVAMLCVLACGPAVGLAALIAAGYLAVYEGANFFDAYFTWYFADVLALVTATPVLAAFRVRELVGAI